MKKRRAIVVAEDDADTLHLICRALRRMVPDCEIRHALNGKEAQSELTREPEAAILITDLDMPLVNGFELIQWAREAPHLSDLRIVVFSGSPEDCVKERCEKLNVDDVIRKNGKMDLLQTKVAALMARNGSMTYSKIE